MKEYRGPFLESGVFIRWQNASYFGGIKVLAPKDPKASIILPESSNTPGTAYAYYGKDGTFDRV